jgi:hypothetical protein
MGGFKKILGFLLLVLHSHSVWGSMPVGLQDHQASVSMQEPCANPIVPTIIFEEDVGSKILLRVLRGFIPNISTVFVFEVGATFLTRCILTVGRRSLFKCELG